MPAGRPTDYSEDMPEKAREYLANCVDKFEVVGQEKPLVRQTVDLPTIQGLSLFLGVAQSTVYLWATEHPAFSEALEEIKAEQAKRLLNKGLSGDYNSTIAKLILSSNHGMRERVDSDLTSNGKPIPILANALQDNHSHQENSEAG